MTRAHSLTLRLTLLFASVSTAVLLLLGILVGALVEEHFAELDRELLEGRLHTVQHVLAQVGSAGEPATLPNRLAAALPGHHGQAVTVRAGDGRVLFASGDLVFPDSLLASAGWQSAAPSLWRSSDGRRFRGIAALATTSGDGQPPAVVAVATDIAHHEQFMHAFRIALWSVVTLAALLSGFLGWLAARRGLAPLRQIQQRAAAITASRLDQRLEVDTIPAELAEVAATLNDMLARLQQSFRRLSDFSSDLAHELRTPLSNLLTQTQVTLGKARSVEEYRAVLASNAEECQRLSRMVADMLFLARADNEQLVPQREPVDLQQEAAKLIEFYAALAEDKRVRLTLAPEVNAANAANSATVPGDRLMLQRAMANLLANALQHTPANGEIAVRIDAAVAGTVTLAVENSGKTIPAEQLPRLFDRFYRADASRQRLAGDSGTAAAGETAADADAGALGAGLGLGLAIVRSIAQAHGGEVSVSSANGVTRFALSLPAA